MHQTIEFPSELDSLLSSLQVRLQQRSRPLVTLSYAQSLDGSIAARRSATMALSGAKTIKITHSLRAKHSAILVGIGTLIADDPQLNVRLVTGSDPQPVVLDSQLRFPLEARLLRGQKSPWIFTNNNAQPQREAILTKAGVRVFRSDNADGRQESWWFPFSVVLESSPCICPEIGNLPQLRLHQSIKYPDPHKLPLKTPNAQTSRRNSV